jgi:EAL domain-containing protein (putative c-di-GMP-specific phosphodiesterase class I)
MSAATTGRGLSSVFQPIVSLPDEVVIGYEALSRWAGSAGSDPVSVFARARANGRLEALDQLCIDTAIDTAAGHVIGAGAMLSINCEASTVYHGRSADEVKDRAGNDLAVMFEFTERGLLAHPRALMRKVVYLRERGFLISLDDVGAHPDSMALLDVIRPDVVKLDLRLIQAQPRYAQARTLAAVLAHEERTGAIILAEGIETDEHLEQALALGASLGQGYRFGRPEPFMRAAPGASSSWVAPRERCNVDAGSPFDLVASRTPVRTARKATLTAFSRQIETTVKHGTETPLVFTALQDVQNYEGVTARRYRQLAGTCPLVAVFGREMPVDLGHGVRGVTLAPEDPLCREWTVVALGAHTSVALIARERLVDGEYATSDGDRRFDFVMTHDRSLVTRAARNLLDRMT